MFNKAEMELFLKSRGQFFESDKKVNPSYGIVYSIIDSRDKTIVAVGIVNYPLKFSNQTLVGHNVVSKEEVIANTNKGIRYTTIIKTLSDPWVPGQLVHTDGNKSISTNPNDITIDNLKNLALGEFSRDEILEILDEL